MKHFVIIFVLVINAALVKSQWGLSSLFGRTAGGAGVAGSGGLSASGGVQIGGCSIGASGSGNAGLYGGGASGSASANCGTPNTGDTTLNPGDTTPQSGYTYEINATRTMNIVGKDDAVVDIKYQVTPTQTITYLRSIGPTNPIMIEGYIMNTLLYFANDEDSLLNSCDNFQSNSWEYVTVEMVKKSVIPGGNCTVEKGDYTIYDHVDPIYVTFPEMIECGEYEVRVLGYVAPNEKDLQENPDEKWTWAYMFYYTFTIPNDGNCTIFEPASE